LTIKAAKEFNGREYPVRLTDELKRELASLELVVVMGGSDDIMSFAGAIHDEVDCYDGGTAFLDKCGLLERKCEFGDCPHEESVREKSVTIEAIWGADGYSWTYKTAIPHDTFEIMDGDDKYCRGIVFSMSDLKGCYENTQ
jgi:hypothetical protein